MRVNDYDQHQPNRGGGEYFDLADPVTESPYDRHDRQRGKPRYKKQDGQLFRGDHQVIDGKGASEGEHHEAPDRQQSRGAKTDAVVAVSYRMPEMFERGFVVLHL